MQRLTYKVQFRNFTNR